MGAGAGVGKDGLLGISGNGKRSTTRLLDAEFPKFRQLLPAEHTAVATINVAELTEAIKLVALVADRGAQVRMEFSEGSLRLSAGRRRRPGRRRPGDRFRRRTADHRLQSDVLDRRTGFGAFRAGVVWFHDSGQAGVAAPGAGRRQPPDRAGTVQRPADRLRLPVDACPVAWLGVRPAFRTARLPVLGTRRPRIATRSDGLHRFQRVWEDESP